MGRFDPLRIETAYPNVAPLELPRQQVDKLHHVIHHGKNHDDVEQLGQVIQDRDSHKADRGTNVIQ